MIDWIGSGWIAAEGSGPNTFFVDLTIEVPRGEVVAAAAVTGSSVGVWQHEPGSIAVYIREYGRFKSSTMIEVVDVPPDPTNNVMAILDCAFVRFRMTVFQAKAFSQGLVFRFAPPPPPPPNPRTSVAKLKAFDFKVRVGGREIGKHRIMALARGSRLRQEALLRRSAAEAGRFLGVRAREIETLRVTARRRRKGESPVGSGVF
jgi:hypothetical protein